MKVEIFQKEIADGVADLVQTRSVAHCVGEVRPQEKTPRLLEDFMESDIPDSFKEVASINDFDVYPTLSLLVSSVWNENDTIFLPSEIAMAKDTPVHKPDNLNHNENLIVGHSTASRLVDDQLNELEYYDGQSMVHILTDGVIYKYWENPKRKAMVDELIQKIESGEKSVSMECLMPAFDYAVGESDDYVVVPRNEDTAYLTKYLRAYKGKGVCKEGEHAGKRIGRVPRNLVFSGKGYVDNPANKMSRFLIPVRTDMGKPKEYSPDLNALASSINDDDGVRVNNNNGEAQPNSNNNQPNYEEYAMKELIEQLNAQVAELKKQLDERDKTIAEFDTATYKKQIDELTVDRDEAKAELEAIKAKFEEDQKEIQKSKAEVEGKVEELDKQVAELAKEKEELEKQIAEAQAEQLRANRVATLVDGGLDKEEATKKVETFASLNDEQFTEVANVIIDSIKASDSEEDSEESDEDKDKETAGQIEDDLDKDSAGTSLPGGQGEDEDVDERQEIFAALASKMAK